MEPIPVRAIPVEESPLSDVDAEAAEAAVVGTARFAMWIGATFALLVIAVAVAYRGLPATIRAARNPAFIYVCVVSLTVAGGLAILSGALLLYRRIRAGCVFIIGGAVGVMAGSLADLGYYQFKNFFNSQNKLAQNTTFVAQAWLNELGTLAPAVGCLLLAVVVRGVVRRRSPIVQNTSESQDPSSTLSYSTATDQRGERAVRGVCGIMFALTFGVAALHVAYFAVTLTRGFFEALFDQRDAMLKIGAACDLIPIVFMLIAAVLYVARKSFVGPLLVASAILVIGKTIEMIYRLQYFRPPQLPSGYVNYLRVSIVALAWLKLMIPSANFVWFSRPVVRRVMANRH